MINIKKSVLYFIFILIISIVGCSFNDRESQNHEEIDFILDWLPNTNHTGLYVAQEKGYFTEEGLKVKIHYPTEDSSMLLVASGKGQIGIGFQDSLAIVAANDIPLPVTAVAAIIQHNTSGIISLKKNNIHTPKMLEGKTYITWNSNVETAILNYILNKCNADINKVNIIENSSIDVISSLKNSNSAATAYYGWDGIAASMLIGEISFIPFNSIDLNLDYYSPIIIVNDKYLKYNEFAVRKFLKALSRGYKYAIDNPKDAALILLDQVSEMDRELVLKSQIWLSAQYSIDCNNWGFIDETRWNNFNLWLFENGVINKKLPLNSCLKNNCLDNN